MEASRREGQGASRDGPFRAADLCAPGGKQFRWCNVFMADVTRGQPHCEGREPKFGLVALGRAGSGAAECAGDGAVRAGWDGGDPCVFGIGGSGCVSGKQKDRGDEWQSGGCVLQIAGYAGEGHLPETQRAAKARSDGAVEERVLPERTVRAVVVGIVVALQRARVQERRKLITRGGPSIATDQLG